MARKKPIISPLGQWAYPGEVTIIPSSKITMKGVNYPVLGVDDLGNSKVMMPGGEYTFPGNYVTEFPQMNKGGQMIKRKDGSYSKRGLWDNIRANKGSGKKPTKEMLEQERKIKAKMQNGGWLDQYQVGGPETSTEQNPERMQGVNINVKRKKVSDNPTYQYDNQGNLLYKPDINISPYLLDNSTRDSFWVNPKLPIKNLNPTVEELRQVAAPYYPIDNKLVTNSKLTFNYAEAKPSNYQESLEQEYVLPEVVGKSFGNFPLVKDDGYSPNRRWITSLRNGDKLATGYRNDSGIRAYGPNKYAYVLKTDPNNLVNYPTKDKIENDLSLNNKVFYDYLAKNNYSPDTVDGLTRELPDQIWNRAAQMQVEMRNNPEIMSWANLHNLDLGYKPRYEDSEDNDDFAPKIPESIYAARLAKAGLPTNRPDYDYDEHETYIAQDPSKFSLVDYFPVDPFLKDAKNNPKNKKDEWGNVTDDQALKKQMAKRMGIDPSAFDNGEYLIHYNKSPITEYTPGKKYGGWLEEYQSGGLLSKDDYDLTIAPKRGDYLLPDINRPYYIDDAGERRTEYKIGINVDGKETLIPTVVGGRQLTEDEARDRYRKTGLHMGQFNTPEEADYAARLRTARYKMLEDPINFQANQFQVGGEWLNDEPEVNPKIGWNSGNRYSYDKKGNLIYTNHPLSFDYGVEQFIERAINNKSSWLGNSLNDYELDFLKNAKNKIQNLDVWPTSLKFQVQTKVDKLNPSLDELINVTQNIYPDQYAIDNSFSKASKSRIDLPASAFENDIKERYVIPEILKNSINKRFGTLPTTRDDSYSPNRIWTTKVKNDEDSNVGARFAIDEDNSKYAYILTPDSKKTSDLSKEKINTKKENIENLLSSADNKFYENLYLKYPDYIQYPGNYNNPEISLFGDIKNILPNQMWNRAEQMRVEMLNNPEIKDWADLHNVNLSRGNEDSKQNLVIDGFAPKVPESVYANRLVKAGLPVSTPDYDYGSDDTYIVQDPSKFNLAGYFPIPKDYDEENAKQLIAKKLGIKQEQLNSKDYLIHYNQSPITEYTPGKKYGGWLEQYQSGGSFMNAIKIAMTPELRGFVGNQLVDKGVSKVAQKVGDVSKQQLFERYRPVDYPDPVGAFFNMGKDVPLRDLEGDYHISEEAWRLALGLPTESKYISPSKYKPTKADDPNAQYYSLNNVYDPQKLINAYIEKAHGKPGQSVQMNALSPYLINKDRMVTDNEMPFTETDPLQNFTLSQGEDAKGRYISIYDKYDFNVPYMDDVVYGSNRKPYEFYDRFYYKKDANGRPVYVKQKKDGGQTNWLDKYK